MRIFAIGDIHGRLDLLEQLLDKLYNEASLNLTQDKLIFLGDYIDRGVDSKGVLDKIRSLIQFHPDNVIALAGNHEHMAIDASCKPNTDGYFLWTLNGGVETLDSFYPPNNSEFVSNRVLPDDYVMWLNSLPTHHTEPGFFFSHAPLPTINKRQYPFKGNTPQENFWTREELTWPHCRNLQEEEYNTYKFKKEKLVGVCGHNHALRYEPMLMKPRFYKHYIFTDSGCGCYYKAPLSAVEVVSRTVYQAWPIEAQETHYETE